MPDEIGSISYQSITRVRTTSNTVATKPGCRPLRDAYAMAATLGLISTSG